MNKTVFGEIEKFAIIINNYINVPSGVYGNIVIYLDGNLLGDLGQECFVNQVADYLFKIPNVSEVFLKEKVNISERESLDNFFFQNTLLERFQYISGLGECFDNFLMAYFIYKDDVYFVWKEFNSPKYTDFRHINLAKISKGFYFEVLNALEKYLTDFSIANKNL